MVETDGLARIPDNWTSAKLGEIVLSFNPSFPSGKHNKDGRGVPHLRPMNITSKGEISLVDLKYVEESNYQPLVKGDIIFNNTNSPALLGKTSYIRQDTNWAYSNHMTRIKVDQDALNSAWIAYFLHHLFLTGYFQANCTNHVNQASINTGFLSERVQVPLRPLPEQNRIVAKIEELFTKLDAGVDALKKAQAQLKRYRQAVLKAAVTGELTREWRTAHQGELEPGSALLARILKERYAKWEADQLAKMKAAGKPPENDDWKKKYQEPVSPDTSDIVFVPDGWIIAGIDQITTHITSGSRDWSQYYGRGSGIFLMAQNIKMGSLDLSYRQLVDPPIDNRDRFRSQVEEGDLLVTIVGANTGDVCRVPDSLPEHYVCQSVE